MIDEPCPFGEHLARYWAKLSPRERAMQLDAEALYSIAVQEVALPIAEKTPGPHVVDAFCGAGGFAIALARAGRRVTAIDLDAGRLAMAESNCRTWGVTGRVSFRHGDALGLIPTFRADAILLDPPWGGPDYSRRERFALADFRPDGRMLLDTCLATGAAITMRLPKNFDASELESFGRPFAVEENHLRGKLEHLTAYFPR